MRDIFQAVFSKLFWERLYSERKRLKLTQKSMSEILLMDLRTYADLEHKFNSCGGLTLALFLIYCCEDRLRFLQELEDAWKKALEDEYASV